MKVVWSRQALIRLGEIEDYIAAESPASAARLMDRLIDRAEALRRFPDAGRAVPELSQSNLRELIEGNYRIIYRAGRAAIEVVTVFEGHRRLPETDLE